ncbi:hypothetical protein [Meiothermus cerbereus]|uniref:hypothetical protein n=1 Tax=Meiothermus cerbereus TaxID=65552 RepID=UPI003EED07BA
MRRINDPLALRDYLSRLTSETLTPAQARLLLASRGIRAKRKAVEAALAAFGARAAQPPRTKPEPARPRLKSLDDLPLTPEEREIMERLRRERI